MQRDIKWNLILLYESCTLYNTEILSVLISLYYEYVCVILTFYVQYVSLWIMPHTSKLKISIPIKTVKSDNSRFNWMHLSSQKRSVQYSFSFITFITFIFLSEIYLSNSSYTKMIMFLDIVDRHHHFISTDVAILLGCIPMVFPVQSFLGYRHHHYFHHSHRDNLSFWTFSAKRIPKPLDFLHRLWPFQW